MNVAPEDVAEFLVAVATGTGPSKSGMEEEKSLALGTIRNCLAAINRRYKERDLESPARHLTVASVLRGLGRLTEERPRQVKALREQRVGLDRPTTRPPPEVRIRNQRGGSFPRLDKIMEVTRHANTGMVMRYIRQADAFKDHAGAALL